MIQLASFDNLVEVCKAHRKGFETLKDFKQPLLEVSWFPSVIDRLNPAADPFKPSTLTYKCQSDRIVEHWESISRLVSQTLYQNFAPKLPFRQGDYLIHMFASPFNNDSPNLSTFRTALLLPCIMRRVDGFLLVKELNAALFNRCISDELLHAALSPSSAVIEYDYERLEMLGDPNNL